MDLSKGEVQYIGLQFLLAAISLRFQYNHGKYSK